MTRTNGFVKTDGHANGTARWLGFHKHSSTRSFWPTRRETPSSSRARRCGRFSRFGRGQRAQNAHGPGRLTGHHSPAGRPGKLRIFRLDDDRGDQSARIAVSLHRGRIALCNVSSQMNDMLDIMHLKEIWMIFDTRKIALRDEQALRAIDVRNSADNPQRAVCACRVRSPLSSGQHGRAGRPDRTRRIRGKRSARRNT